MTEWQPDVLGEGFECTVLDLGMDDEGELVATLVRSLPEPLGFWARLRGKERMLEDVDVLYVHGWADYFFQTDLARYFTERGARFFALDLRKYGRSLREGQTPCYIEDLQSYDQEIGLSLDIMRESAGGGAASDGTAAHERADAGEDADAGERADPQGVPGRRLLLLGHSTGGLVLSLWSDRHRGAADGLLLNSPWLELQVTGAGRRFLTPVVNMRAKLNPYELALPQFNYDTYSRAQRAACGAEEIARINHAWRPEKPLAVLSGWLRAIMTGHARIDANIEVGVPACVLLSRRSHLAMTWSDDMARADTVLEVESVAKAALKLGSSVTIERIDGALHDVFLSEASARADAYARMDRWLRGWQTTAKRSR